MATPVLSPLPEPMPEPLPEPMPTATPEPPPRQSFLYKSIITLYRVFAVATLYAILVGILAYAFIMGFYALNTTWAAPVILSASDEKSLDFLQKLVTSRQTLQDLHVDILHQQTTLAEMTKHRAALEALDPQIQQAIARENTHDRLTGPQLAALDTQKQADNTKTQAVLAQLAAGSNPASTRTSPPASSPRATPLPSSPRSTSLATPTPTAASPKSSSPTTSSTRPPPAPSPSTSSRNKPSSAPK